MDNEQHVNLHLLTAEDLRHLASCDCCAEQLADCLEDHGLLHAPKNMKAEILNKSRQFDIQIVAKSNHASKKMELFYYTLKVGLAAAFAIVVLVLTPAAHRSAITPKESVFQSHSQFPSASLISEARRICNKFNDLTYQFIPKGGNNR